MAAPLRTLADANLKVTFVTVPPKDINAMDVDTLNAAMQASCRILKSDYRFSPTTSEMLDSEAALCEEGNPQSLGRSNFEGAFSVFRYFDPENPGQVDLEGDEVYQAVKEKGTPLWIVERHSAKKENEPWEVGDTYDLYEVETDTPQKPGNVTEGYIKRHIPTVVKRVALDKSVVDAPTGG